MNFGVLDKFDHLSLYYLYHFLSKKLKKDMSTVGKESMTREELR